MELVIDANILFSALIRDSITAKMLFDDSLNLYTPEFIIEEFAKHEGTILNKTARTKNDFVQIMHSLNEIITIIPEEEYFGYMQEAAAVSPDEKDVAYLALAMKLRCGIWSNDKRLKEQDKIKVYNTHELMRDHCGD
ncbi:MAG: PIN domain-containing protein [Thermoplasmata archaeon]